MGSLVIVGETSFEQDSRIPDKDSQVLLQFVRDLFNGLFFLLLGTEKRKNRSHSGVCQNPCSIFSVVFEIDTGIRQYDGAMFFSMFFRVLPWQ